MSVESPQLKTAGRENTWQSKLLNVLVLIVLVMSALFTGLLSVATVLFTVLSDYAQTKFTVSWSGLPWVILGVVVFGFLLIFFSKKAQYEFTAFKEGAKFTRNLVIGVFIYGFVMSFAWVLISDTEPFADSADLYRFAQYYSMHINGQLDSSKMVDFLPNGYLDKYPFQIPFMYVVLVFGQLTNWANITPIFGVINAISNGFAFAFIVLIVDWLAADKRANIVAFVLCALFFPLILYATFVYGNNIALALAMAAFYLFIRSVTCRGNTEERAKRPVLCLVIAAVLMTLSVLFKSTMQIATIALALTGVVFFLLDAQELRLSQRIGRIILSVTPFAASKVIVSAIIAFTAATTGTTVGAGGLPSTTWIVMGTGGQSEYIAAVNENDSLAFDLGMPGYYAGYPFVDVQLAGFKSWDDMNHHWLAVRAKRYIANPGYAAQFFGRKLLIEWTEPTFEGYMYSNWDRPGYPAKISANRDYTPLGRFFYYDAGHTVTSVLMDINQSLIAIGAFVFFLFMFRNRKRGKICSACLVLVIFTLGGAVLYVFWETKAQYMLPFFFTLIPYAACGWSQFANWSCTRSKLLSKLPRRRD